VLRPALPLLAAFWLGCSSNSATPTEVADSGGADTNVAVADTATSDSASDAGPDVNFPDPFTACTKDPGPGTVTITPVDGGGDPTGGADKFTLDMALQGFPAGTGKLKAAITTEKGVIVCAFDEINAPISVANFIGLARGTRPYLKSGIWVVGRFYDGLKWHRVIPGFVIQGGDPRGTGSGGPGYDLVNENHVAEPLGTLAMAAGTEPSGSQFYIVVGTGPAPDYNVFGTCDTDVAIDISGVDTNPKNDKPLVDIHMLRVDIARCP